MSLGSFTRPPTRTGALGPFSFGAIGWRELLVCAADHSTEHPTHRSAGHSAGYTTGHSTRPFHVGIGASFSMAISFGTIVGATNLPEFSKTRCTGAALMSGAGPVGAAVAVAARQETSMQTVSGPVSL